MESEFKANPMLKVKIEDLIRALDLFKNMAGLKYLSDGMKAQLVDGFLAVKYDICHIAYRYYETHDFECTESIIPLMREVVMYG